MKMIMLRSAIIATAALTSGCGTLMHGPMQSVGVSSSPTNASITVDGSAVGITPYIAELERKENHIVSISLDGYEPQEMTLNKTLSGWVWGNIVFGGFIGLGVDAVTGSIFKLTPEQLTAEFQAPQANLGTDGQIFISFVLKPNKEWERIGQL